MGLLVGLVYSALPAWAQGPRVAVVSVAPVGSLVQRVGGDRVLAEVLVRPGQEPHGFEPTPRQMARLSKASVYFTIGLPFEHALAQRLKAAGPQMAIVDAAQGIQRHKAEEPGHHGHGHGDHEYDPHIWLSPTLAMQMAQKIAAGLSKLDPSGREYYQANLAVLTGELREAKERMAGLLAPYHGQAVMVFHPAFGYLLGEFGLKQWAMQAEGKEPGARFLAGLIKRAHSRGIKVIFVQSQFTQAAAQAMAREAGMRLKVLDPLAADYPASLERMAEAIARALGERERAGGGS